MADDTVGNPDGGVPGAAAAGPFFVHVFGLGVYGLGIRAFRVCMGSMTSGFWGLAAIKVQRFGIAG